MKAIGMAMIGIMSSLSSWCLADLRFRFGDEALSFRCGIGTSSIIYFLIVIYFMSKDQ